MKLAVLYYSSTGNTLFALKYLTSKLDNIKIEFIDVCRKKIINHKSYDLFCFASPTFHLGIHPVMEDYIKSIDKCNNKPAILFNTFGMMQGKVLKILKNKLEKKGVIIHSGFSLRMPENYPLYIKKNLTDVAAPSLKEIKKFDLFIDQINKLIKNIKIKNKIDIKKIKIGFFNTIIPPLSNQKIAKTIQNLTINKEKCTLCKKCSSICPSYAITIKNHRIFNMEKCIRCFSCFNNCPNQAINTDKVECNFQYDLKKTNFYNIYKYIGLKN